MENLEHWKVISFLTMDDNGDGSGFGDGNGNGSGYGFGSGDGSGDGYGFGSGRGYGSGIKIINGFAVYIIDNIQTIFTSIKQNIAKGYILSSDLNLTPCYIVKDQNVFAHGKTLKQAHQALQDKLFNNMDVSERIELFLREFKLGEKYSAIKYFNWHNKLTGSCEMGRKAFINNNNINLDKDMYTVDEFIQLTKNSYGGEIIKQLESTIKAKTIENL